MGKCVEHKPDRTICSKDHPAHTGRASNPELMWALAGVGLVLLQAEVYGFTPSFPWRRLAQPMQQAAGDRYDMTYT